MNTSLPDVCGAAYDIVYLSTAYLAPIQYYSKLTRYDEVRIETHENYQKQTYRNRCVIVTANGLQTLTVPIEKPDTIKCLTRDIRISKHGDWRRLHWNALVSAYNKSPFFEFLADDFRPFYDKTYEYLVDFNEALQAMVCDILEINPKIIHTETYDPVVKNDFRNVIDPRHPQPDNDFTITPYCQVFQHKSAFVPNVSIVDLIFNLGKEAIFFIR